MIETVTIEFNWENVMGVPLPINSVHLVCSFNSSPPIQLNDLDFTNNNQWSETEYYRTEIILDFSLDSGEMKPVTIFNLA